MRKPWALKEWREKRREFLKGKCCGWCGSTEIPLTIHHPQGENVLSDEKYMSFDGVIVLCKRCHFALHKGLHLCPSCRKKYVSNRFDICFDCFSLTKQGKEVLESQKEQEAEAEYEMRLQYCGNCKFHIEVDQELFCGLSPSEMCDHGLFEEDGVRRFVMAGN